MVLTEEVAIITGCGFRLPEGRENYWRWFAVANDGDLVAIAELVLGLLTIVFGHQPGDELHVTMHMLTA